MKRVLIALLLLTTPVFAQTTFAGSDPFNGTAASLTVNGDVLQLGILGTRWATVKLVIGTNASGTASIAEISIDGGTNWSTSPMMKQIDAVSANPTVRALSSSSWSASVGTWEIPLSSNVTHVRARAAGAPTGAVPVSLLGGTPYVPGASITAVLSDTTSAVNTAIDTGTVDLSGWEYANVGYTTPAGGSGTISGVDDAGASIAMFTVPASTGAWYPFAVSSPSATQVTALPATGVTGALPIQKRMRFQSAAVAALTSRIRIEVRR